MAEEQTFITTGTIHQIGETEEFGERGFRVRKLVLCPDARAKYPQYIPFSAIYEMCDTLNAYAVGESVEVCFTLEGRAAKNDPERFWGTNKLKDITSLARDFARDPKNDDGMGDDNLAF